MKCDCVFSFRNFLRFITIIKIFLNNTICINIFFLKKIKILDCANTKRVAYTNEKPFAVSAEAGNFYPLLDCK